MEKTDNNKLLAEFMGYAPPHPDYPDTTYWYKKGEQPLSILLFDTNWNWLMQVVEKIEGLNFVVIHHFYFSKFEVSIKAEHNRSFKNIHYSNINSKIEAVYNACIEFVKWYNTKELWKENM
jgi:hypothetical protein